MIFFDLGYISVIQMGSTWDHGLFGCFDNIGICIAALIAPCWTAVSLIFLFLVYKFTSDCSSSIPWYRLCMMSSIFQVEIFFLFYKKMWIWERFKINFVRHQRRNGQFKITFSHRERMLSRSMKTSGYTAVVHWFQWPVSSCTPSKYLQGSEARPNAGLSLLKVSGKFSSNSNGEGTVNSLYTFCREKSVEKFSAEITLVSQQSIN